MESKPLHQVRHLFRIESSGVHVCDARWPWCIALLRNILCMQRSMRLANRTFVGCFMVQQQLWLNARRMASFASLDDRLQSSVDTHMYITSPQFSGICPVAPVPGDAGLCISLRGERASPTHVQHSQTRVAANMARTTGGRCNHG